MQTEKDSKNDLEKVSKKFRRISRYLEEKKRKTDKRFGIAYCGCDMDYEFSQAAYMNWEESEQEKKSCQALYEALADLKEIDPVGYRMIIEYYLIGRATTTEIGKKNGISQQACSNRIRKCLTILQKLVMLHIND
jgi:uncharacterized protein YerC